MSLSCCSHAQLAKTGTAVAMLLAALLWPAQAPADEALPSQQELAQLLASRLEARYGTNARATAEEFYGELSEEKHRIVAAHFRQKYLQDLVPERLAERLHPRLMAGGLTLADLDQASDDILDTLVDRGYGRVSSSDRLDALKYTADFLKALTDDQCQAVVLETVPQATIEQWDQRYLATRPLGEFQAVLARNRRAFDAELRGTEPAVTATPEQLKRSAAMHDAETARRLAYVPTETAQRVSADLSSASAQDLCTFSVTALEALFSIEEPYRSWQALQFFGTADAP